MAILHLVRAAALLVIVVGCTSAPVTPLPQGSDVAAWRATSSLAPTAKAPVTPVTPLPQASLVAEDWQTANLALPSAVTSAPSLEPGYQCHPCHYLAENQLFGVGQTAAGLIAVGIQEPPQQAVAFSSANGRDWVPLAGFPDSMGAAVAVASHGARTVVVGNDSNGAAAWATDGQTWAQAPRQAALDVAYAAGAMESVVTFRDGFVAGGYRDDPVHAAPSAAVWRSADGLTWQLDDGLGIFAGGRIWGVAANADTIVAVGTGADPNYGPAAAWRWTQAQGWQIARIGPDAAGAMRAVTATPSGFVAVGLNGQDAGASVWTSRDGMAWTAVADQPAFHYYLSPIRMRSVVAGPSGLVAAGWRSDAGKGSAVTWASADGQTWQGPVWQTSFSGGQIAGLAVTGGEVVAVGRTGYPDWNQATIWVNRAP